MSRKIHWVHFGASGLTQDEVERATCTLNEVMIYRAREMGAKFLIAEGDGDYFVRVENSTRYDPLAIHGEIVDHLRRADFIRLRVVDEQAANVYRLRYNRSAG